MKRLGAIVAVVLCTFQTLLAQTEISEPYKKLSEHTDDVNRVVYSMPLRMFASASFDKSVRIYNEEGVQQKFYDDQHQASVEALCFSKDGKYLFSGSNDWKIIQYDIAAGKVVKNFGGFNLPVKALACDPSGKFLFAAFDEDSIKIFDLSAGGQQKRGIPTAGRVTNIMPSYDGRGLIVATQKPEVQVMDIKGNILLTLAGHTDQVNQISVAPNGKYIATASNDKSIILWDPKTGNKIRSIAGHELRVNSVTFSGDGKYLTTASNDKTIKVWEVESGKQIYTIKLASIAKSAFMTLDKKYIVSGGKGISKDNNYGIYIWKIGLDSIDKPAVPNSGKPKTEDTKTAPSQVKGSAASVNTTTKPADTATNSNGTGSTAPNNNPAPRKFKPSGKPTNTPPSNPAPKPNVINSTTPGSTVYTDSATVSKSIDSARIQQLPPQVGDSTLNNIKNEKKSKYKRLK